jgi:hypothetical protein
MNIEVMTGTYTNQPKIVVEVLAFTCGKNQLAVIQGLKYFKSFKA